MSSRYLHPILSPDDLKGDPSMNVTTLSDWVRLGKFVRGELPKEWPPILEFTPGFDWLGRWRDDELVVLDTEYLVPSRFVYQVGLYILSTNTCIIWDRNNPAHATPGELRRMLLDLVSRARVISQNLQAEMLSLHATFGIGVRDWPRVEDTMLMHSALWSELRHGLGFLASVYGEHEKVKHYGPGSYEYLRGDVVETANVYKALRLEMMNDEGARLAYEDRLLPLVPILCEHNLRGIDIDASVVDDFARELKAQTDAQLLRAQAYAGWPINPDSGDQLGLVLSQQEDVYSLVKGSGIRRKFTASGKVSFSKDKIAELVTELEARGIDHPLISSRKAYIEARQMHSLVFQPLLGRDKVHPSIGIHSQATGRWSFTDPPMSLIPAQYRGVITVPDGYALVTGDWSAIEQRVMTWLTDDELEMEVFNKGWDSHILTVCALFGIPLPPDPATWEQDEAWCAEHGFTMGKDDKRRVFAKSFKYSLSYGKQIENVPTIPGAKKLGLKDSELVTAGHRWLSTKPGLKRYWDQVKHQALTTGIVRDVYGRPRRLLNPDLNARQREAMNAPLQATVASFLNETVIMIDRQMPSDWGWMVMTTHDSTYYAIKEEHLDEAIPLLKRVHERPLKLKEGVSISVPFGIEVKRRK